MRHLFLLLSLILIMSSLSCQKKLEIHPDSTSTPEFNFLTRFVEKDTTDARYITLYTEIYLRQLDFQASNESYRLIIAFPPGLDGGILYHGKQFRPGDWIDIPYQSFEQYVTQLKIVLFNPSQGTYTITLQCNDRLNKSKTSSLLLTL